uniref:Uncharacterized protein n=1 Tax=Clytia hemisphaerica TaxID=252671 RepID=A0A7M5UUQ0_9CNID
MAVDTTQQMQLAKNTNQQGMKTFIRLACRISKKAKSCIHRNKKQQQSTSPTLNTLTTTTTSTKTTSLPTTQCSNKKNKLEKRISSDFLVYSTKPCQNKDQIENACAKTKTLETEVCIGGNEVTKVNEYLKRPRRNAVFITTDEEKAGLKLVLRYYIQTQSIKQFVL